jgi:cholinesterase
MKFTTSTSFALLAASAYGSPAEWTVGQAVNTTSGTVIGHAAKLDTSVSEYLGIPLAEPPVGKLRWMPPQPFTLSMKPITAERFGPGCAQMDSTGGLIRGNITSIQSGVLGMLAGSRTISEDCLTLNIWTKPQTGEKKKAVLVWIYGGGFSTGSTQIRSYNGVKFAGNQDVVLVSINYRLMIMGFPANPELFNDVNVGLIDQRKALEWVKANIEAFGGDPNRITIFGESAGGRAVDIYSFAWVNEKDPVVNGFIAESGAAPQNTGWKPQPDAWFKTSTRLGCGGKDKGKATIACMQNKTMAEVLSAVKGKGGAEVDLRRSFMPSVDEKTYFGDYDKRREAGKFIQKVGWPWNQIDGSDFN